MTVARNDRLERVVALPPGSCGTSDLWTEVHDEIQGQLALLETEVRRRVAGVHVRCGRTSGDRFFLFSYRTFSLPESTVDPAVAGVTFTPADAGVAVEADVSGERSGDWISSVPGQKVPKSREELLAVAHSVSKALCQAAEPIVTALNDASRKAE